MPVSRYLHKVYRDDVTRDVEIVALNVEKDAIKGSTSGYIVVRGRLTKAYACDGAEATEASLWPDKHSRDRWRERQHQNESQLVEDDECSNDARAPLEVNSRDGLADVSQVWFQDSENDLCEEVYCLIVARRVSV